MQSATVLIVEDEALVSLMLEDFLTEAGFHSIGVYRSGAAALEHLKRQAPDVLLLDVFLQGELSGVDLARAVREVWSGPIVFYTAAANPGFRDQMAAIPNAAIVFKPAAAHELVRAIRELLGGRRA